MATIQIHTTSDDLRNKLVNLPLAAMFGEATVKTDGDLFSISVEVPDNILLLGLNSWL